MSIDTTIWSYTFLADHVQNMYTVVRLVSRETTGDRDVVAAAVFHITTQGIAVRLRFADDSYHHEYSRPHGVRTYDNFFSYYYFNVLLLFGTIIPCISPYAPYALPKPNV